jgi:thimet oligopeptidase
MVDQMTMTSDSAAARLVTSAPEEFTRHAETVIEASQADITRFLASTSTGEALLEEYDELAAHLEDLKRVAQAIGQCHPDPESRAAADAAGQSVGKILAEISLDARVYQRLSAIDLSTSNAATRHYAFKLLRSFRRAGVDKDEATRARLREIGDEMVSLGQTFQRNINAETRVVTVPPSALDGMPEDYVRAHPPEEDGLVRISTDFAHSIPFMTYCHDSKGRELLWREFNVRGYPENVEVLARLLKLRKEFASLLGYDSWAQYVTEDKMIGSDSAAADFISSISEVMRDRMLRDYDELLQRMRADYPDTTDVPPWDQFYLEDRIKAEKLAFDSQALRQYFEYGQVKNGLIAVTEKLFGIEFRLRGDIATWHSDVEVFDVFDGSALLGRIFLDMHPRKDKFHLAGMCALNGGKAGSRVPEALLLANFPRPGEEAALLQHTDVITFFHEFGHTIHHLFAGHQRWAGNAGIKTEGDFTEAPSQLLEEWTRDPATLATFARHYETGEPLPAELVHQMRAADEFGKGLAVGRQLFFSALSLELHRRDPEGLDPLQVEAEMWKRHAPSEFVEGAWIHLSFAHLDGYSAIYYTYLWSLVIAKDLFTAFDPGELLARPVATRYRETVLEPGGSAPAAAFVTKFLGRDYTYDAFKGWLDA